MPPDAPTVITANPYVGPTAATPGGVTAGTFTGPTAATPEGVTAGTYTGPTASAPGGVTAGTYTGPTAATPGGVTNGNAPDETITPATVTLDPSGANNSLLFTAKSGGLDGNSLTAAIAISGTNTFLGVAETSGNVVITSWSKHRITVSGAGTAAANGEYVRLGGGNPIFIIYVNAITGATITSLGNYGVNNEWIVKSSANVEWYYGSVLGAISPDLAGPFTKAVSGSNPVPSSVTAAPATAAQAIALSQAALSVTIANAPGSDGTGALAAAAQTNLSGGTGPSSPLPIT